MEKISFDKEKIKSRILKKAADLWGYKEGEMESFDPLVKLLIEAFAGEFEKIGYEINETQLRIIERLTGLINPDIDMVKPSYSIVQARAVDAGTTVNKDTQFLLKRGEDRGKPPENSENAEVFLSPIDQYNVYNGIIKYCISQGNAFILENGTKKSPFIEKDSKVFEEYNCLWLGLDLEEDAQSMEGMSFFFDWYNEPQKELFCKYLPYTEWFFHNDQKLSVRVGLNSIHTLQKNNTLEELFDISKKTEGQVSSLLNKYFITIIEPFEINTSKVKIIYPEIFEKKFSSQELKLFKKELIWIKIKFPEYCPSEIVNNIFCAINCFPVLNRKIHKINYKVQQSLNVIALESSDSFLTVKDVRGDDNKVYKGIPLAGLNEVEVATYTIRTAINRLDQRQAHEILNYLLELLQDESLSFAAIGEDFLTSQIIELNQNIARLEQRLKKHSDNKTSNPYLVLNAISPGETVFIEYWSTQGESANNIPLGSKASLYSGSYLDNKSIFLMISTAGGREKPRGEQKINLLKKSLLSRDRIVTPEDIKIACWEALTYKARDIQVKKIYEIGQTPFTGFIRTILIEIIPLDTKSLNEEEWLVICADLKNSLESKSTGNWPFKIVLKK